MPVRLPEIPGLPDDRGNLAPMSAEAATAPGRAMGELAQGLADLGEATQTHADRVQRQQNLVLATDTASAWRKQRAEFTLELQNDPDPDSRIRKTDAFLKQLQGDLDTADLPPQVRDELRLDWSRFADDTYLNALDDADQLSRTRAKLSLENTLTTADETGDRGLMEDTLRRGQDAGVLLPEQADKIRANFDRDQTRKGKLRQAMEEPDQFLADHGPEAPEGEDPVEYHNLRDIALRERNQQTAQAADEVLDLIYSGKVTTPEEIEQLTPEMRPQAREMLKAKLADRATETNRLRVLHPQYQADLRGRIRGALDTYAATPDGEDTTYVGIASLIRDVSDPDLAKEFTRVLSNKRSGALDLIETKADEARAKLSNLFKAKAFGSGNTSKSVFTLMSEGILQDPAKLQAEGFTPEQAAAIAADDIDTGDLTKLGLSDEQAKRAAGSGLQARIVRFREMSKLRSGEQTSTAYDAAAYDAIRTGKKGTIETPDQAAQRERDIAYGHAVTKLETWLRLHPQHTDTEANAYLDELTNGRATKEFSDSLIGTPPALTFPEDENPLLPPIDEN